ncbi:MULTISPECIES: ShlB/FhaC/HecB family hemolysin secretion/activation protein [unclassified Lysobacter]
MTFPVEAQTQGDPAAQELRRQQERERILREQQEMAPDVRLEGDKTLVSGRLPTDESPCFEIQRIVLDGDDAGRFRWALQAADPADDPATGRCLGTQGVNVALARVQNAVIGRGFVTTRILAAPQDLKAGTLTLTVVPGRVRGVRFAGDTSSRATAWNAVPVRAGDLLNLRDIEQALENFQRLPTVTADIQIVPAYGDDAQPGESDLVIEWQQRAPARANLTLDDAGSQATGKLQGGATVSLDNALAWNDLFYINLGHDVLNGGHKGTTSRTAHYDVPFDYWLLGATASDYEYHQAVAGAYETYVYSGSSRNAELNLSRLLFRNATIKAGAYAQGWWRESDNFIDDTEVLVQRRRTAGWELGVTYKQFLGSATLDARLAYRRGTGAFGSLAAPEEAFGEGTSRLKLMTADIQLSVPFRLGNQQLRYSGSWRAQWNETPLVPQDRFAIGGRYTVRGFNGELSLSGERGWRLRNDLGLALGAGQELYLGVDYGHVSGPSTQWQLGDDLAGAVVGLRGGHGRLNWDLFVGSPLHEPDGFAAAYTTTGFSLGWAY